MSASEYANTLHEQGCNCCQSVLETQCARFGLDAQLAYRLGAFFGGGMRRGETCGAVTGALMALGLCYGDENNRQCQASRAFLDAFQAAHGSIRCRELLNPDGSGKKELCPKLIAWASDYLDAELADLPEDASL